MSALIEGYALVGDGHTAALLGTPENGRWLEIMPDLPDGAAPPVITRRYRGDTLILETDFETPDDRVSLIDFMPARDGASDLVRIVVGRRGTVKMKMELVLRFDYGSSIPWVSRLPDDSGIRAIAGPDLCVLRTPIELTGENMRTVGEFTMSEGERVPFSLVYSQSHLRLPPALDPHTQFARTENFWLEWSGRSKLDGRWGQAIRRSLITLKALAYEPTAVLLPRRPHRCRSSSEARATGITVTAGYVTPPSPCSR